MGLQTAIIHGQELIRLAMFQRGRMPSLFAATFVKSPSTEIRWSISKCEMAYVVHTLCLCGNSHWQGSANYWRWEQRSGETTNSFCRCHRLTNSCSQPKPNQGYWIVAWLDHCIEGCEHRVWGIPRLKRRVVQFLPSWVFQSNDGNGLRFVVFERSRSK